MVRKHGNLLAGPGVALGGDGYAAQWPLDEDVELLHPGTRHDDDLMPAVDRLFRRRGAAPSDLSRIAVSIGPGGYTGLRIAVATAKMLAEATGAKTIAVPSAHVAAWCLSFSLAPAIVCLASKGDLAHGTLLPPPRGEGDWWEKVGAAGLRPLVDPLTFSRTDQLLREGKSWIGAPCDLGLIGVGHIEALRPRTLIADKFLSAPLADAAARVGAAVVEPIFSPASALHISWHMPPVDPIALAPFYPREPEAVSLWRTRTK
jgi:hypothetical protein